MPHFEFDPDRSRFDDGPYWAAALVLAIRANDRKRAALARRRLRTLGFKVDVTRHAVRKAVARGR